MRPVGTTAWACPTPFLHHIVIADRLIVDMWQFLNTLRMAQLKNRLNGDTADPKKKGGAKTPPSKSVIALGLERAEPSPLKSGPYP